jgi:hypothetical protein
MVTLLKLYTLLSLCFLGFLFRFSFSLFVLCSHDCTKVGLTSCCGWGDARERVVILRLSAFAKNRLGSLSWRHERGGPLGVYDSDVYAIENERLFTQK